jgi:hypothetical protein
MEVTDLIFAVLAPAIAGILATAGYGALGVAPSDFKKARICFVLAAMALGGISIVWGLTTIHPLAARLFITAIFGAIAVSGVTEALRWVAGREHMTLPSLGASPPVIAAQPQLSPSEKDRLSNVLFGLSQILTGQGDQIVMRASAFSRTHLIGQGLMENVNPEDQMAKLTEIRNDLTALYDSIYNDFVQKNSYYWYDITQLIQSQLPIENMKEAANSYINVWNIVNQTPGLDKAKKGGLIDLPHRDFLRTLNDFQQWLIACNQRIGQKRVALR